MDTPPLEREFEDFSKRVAALREARSSAEGGHDLLDALFLELAVAEEELQVSKEELAAKADQFALAHSRSDRERGLLRAVFAALPVPLFLLNHEGSISRANRAAGVLLDVSPTYLVGKPLLAFVDLPVRAVFRSRLSAVLRGSGYATFGSRLSRQGGPEDVHVRLRRVDVSSERAPIVAVLAEPGDTSHGEWPGDPGHERATAFAGDAEGERFLRLAARRLDIMSRMTALLLDEESLREPLATRRAAHLLASEFADWAIIDLFHDGRARRVVVVGPEGDRNVGLLEGLDPADAPVLADVAATGNSVLHVLLEDDHLLGADADERPVLLTLRVGSMLCVPIRVDEEVLGTVTLLRDVDSPRFDIADLGLLEEMGEHLGRALRMDRSYRRHSDAEERLQATLLPPSPLSVPSIDSAATYRPATEGTPVGGDFYDVFETGEGVGFVLGDVCGKGEQAAMVAAAVRNWIQLLGLKDREPASVLAQVNAAMLAHQGSEGRFVTVEMGRLYYDTAQGTARVVMASAGHPQAMVVAGDGSVRRFGGGGLPLGVFADAAPATEEVTLGFGEALVLYSDGVTDVRAADGDLYGDERLAEVLGRGAGLSAAAIVKEVEDDVARHGSGRARDDVTMLILRVPAGGG